jgi:D-inositol-3-phosphate glycosyltransferase
MTLGLRNMTLANHSTLEPISRSGTNQRDLGSPVSEIEAALLTGGFDRPYAFGLSMALASKGVRLDVIGSKELDGPEMRSAPKLNFLNLHGDQRKTVGTARKLLRHLAVYGRLIRYAATAKPYIFHILWNYKFQLFDRIFLMLYYKLLGRKIVFTAHNVNTAQRDGNDSAMNRLSLRVQYRLVDHIFVHTEKMKSELIDEFGIREEKVSVIPFGINNSIPDTELTPAQAKRRVGVSSSGRTILFFGGIRPYKGLEYLVAAFQQIALKDGGYRLIIAGEPKRESVGYWQEIQQTIQGERTGEQVIQEIRFIADEETEVYFKAADVLVLPYTLVSQSGVLFLAYSFGLPVIATNVGSLKDDIVEGETGYTCRSCDAADLARVIEIYFESALFKTLDHRREEIREFARGRNSWDVVSDKTYKVYAQLLAPSDEQKYRPAI